MSRGFRAPVPPCSSAACSAPGARLLSLGAVCPPAVPADCRFLEDGRSVLPPGFTASLCRVCGEDRQKDLAQSQPKLDGSRALHFQAAVLTLGVLLVLSRIHTSDFNL